MTPVLEVIGRSRRDIVETVDRYVLHLRLLILVAPIGFVVMCGLVTIAAGTTIGSTIAVGQVVGAVPAAVRDGLGSPSAVLLWRWFAVFAVAQVTAQIVGPFSAYLGNRIGARHTARSLDLLAEAGLAPHGIAHLDHPRQSTRLRTLLSETRDWQFVAMGTQAGWSIVQNRLTAIGVFVVLAGWRWWVPVVVAIAYMLLSRAFTAWVETLFSREVEVAGAEIRRAEYVRSLLNSSAAAKEVRLFGLSGWLADRYHRLWLVAHQLTWAKTDRALRPVLAAAAFQAVTVGAAFVLLAADARSGRVDLTAVVILVAAVLQMYTFGFSGDPQIAVAKITTIIAELVRLRRELGLPALRAAPDDHERSTGTGAASVDLDDVHFTYPTRTSPTLDGVSLHVPAGQSVAVVGVNGAGKSTMIKLLAGLYPAATGSVRIDGLDPSQSDAARRRVAVIFQDFIRYPLTLRENVGFGALHATDGDVVDAALHDAGGSSLLERLDQGWDTVLSGEYEGGTDLSGGQWQRVALARALAAVAGGAGVLVLDEPTAALDVRAEAELFDRFLEVTGGITTILVSHRLSSVRHAERIVVLDGTTGRIIEDGSHADLISAGGQYADLFALQARRFASAGADGVVGGAEVASAPEDGALG